MHHVLPLLPNYYDCNRIVTTCSLVSTNCVFGFPTPSFSYYFDCCCPGLTYSWKVPIVMTVELFNLVYVFFLPEASAAVPILPDLNYLQLSFPSIIGRYQCFISLCSQSLSPIASKNDLPISALSNYAENFILQKQTMSMIPFFHSVLCKGGTEKNSYFFDYHTCQSGKLVFRS